MSKKQKRELAKLDGLIESFELHRQQVQSAHRISPFGEIIHQLRYQRMLVATQIGKPKLWIRRQFHTMA